MSDPLVYRVNAVQKMNIEDICKKIERYDEPKDFITEAIGMFITWWTNPDKVQEIMMDMAKDLTPEMVAYMKENAPVYAENLEKAVGSLGSQKQQIVTTANGQSQVSVAETIPQNEQLITTPNYYNEFMHSLNDAKEKIESIKISTPKGFLPYDEYPLMWSFYSRFLPIKIVISVLANMVLESDNPKISYKHFRKRAYEIAVVFSQNLRNHENTNQIPRNKRISTGLPVPDSLTNVPANKQLQTMAKIESSKKRFLEHFVGMTEESWKRRLKREPNQAYFDGALNALGLVYFFEEEKELKVSLSKLGSDFYKLANPVIHNGSLVSPISQEEKSFIMKNIIPKLQLEKNIVDNISKHMKKVDKEKDPVKRRVLSTELNEIVRETIFQFIKDDPDTAYDQGIIKSQFLAEKLGKTVNEIDKMSDEELIESIDNLGVKVIDDKDVTAWRVATMGRLSEIDVVKWTIDSHGESFFTLPK